MKIAGIVALGAVGLGIAIGIAMGSISREEMATKQWDGKTIEIPKDQKLINVTWKEENLWYLYRPMESGEQPEIYLFQEQSNFRLMEGTITFKESR